MQSNCNSGLSFLLLQMGYEVIHLIVERVLLFVDDSFAVGQAPPLRDRYYPENKGSQVPTASSPLPRHSFSGARQRTFLSPLFDRNATIGSIEPFLNSMLSVGKRPKRWYTFPTTKTKKHIATCTGSISDGLFRKWFSGKNINYSYQ